jgi:hypothetical protein
MINMNSFFNFVYTWNKDHMLKLGLNRFIEIQANLTIYLLAFK